MVPAVADPVTSPEVPMVAVVALLLQTGPVVTSLNCSVEPEQTAKEAAEVMASGIGLTVTTMDLAQPEELV